MHSPKSSQTTPYNAYTPQVGDYFDGPPVLATLAVNIEQKWWHKVNAAGRDHIVEGERDPSCSGAGTGKGAKLGPPFEAEHMKICQLRTRK